MMADKPVAKISRYPIQAAIWSNAGKDGRTNYSATITKRYRKDDGTYTDTPTLFETDLLVLAEVARMAWEKIGELQAAARGAASAAPAAEKTEPPPF
jgi:hypothetical protein